MKVNDLIQDSKLHDYMVGDLLVNYKDRNIKLNLLDPYGKPCWIVADNNHSMETI